MSVEEIVRMLNI